MSGGARKGRLEKMTLGKALFWGGIAGLAASLVMLIIVLVYLKNKRKKILENLEKNY